MPSLRPDPAASAEIVTLRRRLNHVYWIGGGSGAGKSSTARRIAARYGLQVYETDEAMPDHASRSTPADAPYLAQFRTMDMDQRWLDRSPKTMLETFHWFRGEGFDLVIEDLLRLPPGTHVVAEGFRLLPNLVHPLLAEPAHAVWLLPTPEFRNAAFERRGTTWDIPGSTRDPLRARQNLLARDEMFTERLAKQATQLGLSAIRIDATVTEVALADQVARAFGL